MRFKRIIYLFLTVLTLSGCGDYLNVIPDNIPTLDNAFESRSQAEKFLATCYGSIPSMVVNMQNNPAFFGGDEMCMLPTTRIGKYLTSIRGSRLGRGEQNTSEPLFNYWDGRNGGNNLFIAIRDCNIFLERVDEVPDLMSSEKNRWIAEVKFLKAYFHFFLMRLYGPIPIIKDNLPVDAATEDVRVSREPIDEVVKYIAELVDEAVGDLPVRITANAEEDGRITQTVALAVKAKALMWAASPLFNGNTDYATLKSGNVNLVAQAEDPAKWEAARDAAKAAILAAEEAGHELYYWKSTNPSFSDTTVTKMNIRESICNPWNKEIIWGATESTDELHRKCMPRFEGSEFKSGAGQVYSSPSLRMAELFYTNKGIPMDDDPDYFGRSERYQLQEVSDDHTYYIKPGYKTVKLHLNREPRFYASLCFDGSSWFGNGKRDDDNDFHYVFYTKGKASGFTNLEGSNATGYSPKKICSYRTTPRETAINQKQYSFPMIRLADLYLMYAEALNESEGAVDDVYYYMDKVRRRAGLDGVKASWQQAVNPGKANIKEGLREIIQQERLIELAFEGHRFYDLRRWKQAVKYMNKPIRGWNNVGIKAGENPEDYSIIINRENRSFSQKDYLWPIRESNLYKNENLVQNPGW